MHPQLHGEREWEAFFLRRAAHHESSLSGYDEPVSTRAANGAVEAASGIHVSQAQSYALVEGLTTATRAHARAAEPVEGFHYASRAVTLAANSTRQTAVTQEIEARIVMGATALELSRLPEARREAEAAVQLSKQNAADNEVQLRGWVPVAAYTLLRQVLMALKHFDSAKEASLGVIQASERAFGAGHPAVANALSEHIECVLVAGDAPQAEPDLTEFSIRNEWIKRNRREYVNKTANLQDYTSAVEMADRAISSYRSTAGDATAATIATLGQKAELLSRVGEHAQAIEVQRDAVKFSISLYSKGHQQVADEELALTLLEKRNHISLELVTRMAKAAEANHRGMGGANQPPNRWDALGIDLHRACGFLECSAIETGATVFKECDVCNEVVYCSQQCRLDHWKDGHKDTCDSPTNPTGGQPFVPGDPVDKRVVAIVQDLDNAVVVTRVQANEYGNDLVFGVRGMLFVFRSHTCWLA
jgi:tetratricopeptide (TPR) repeat protein